MQGPGSQCLVQLILAVINLLIIPAAHWSKKVGFYTTSEQSGHFHDITHYVPPTYLLHVVHHGCLVP